MSSVLDSPVTSHDEPPSFQLQSKSSLPRCAVVNFRRDGDLVHVTPRAAKNNGGMAAKVLKFEDAFQLEELSSRTFAFSKKAQLYDDDDDCYDVSAAFSAVAEMDFEEPPSRRPTRRRSTWVRRLSNVLRRHDDGEKRGHLPPPHPWRSSSLGCVPMKREEPRHSTTSIRSRRGLLRRRTARHEMQLFDNGTVLAEPPKRHRAWRFRRNRNNRDLPASPPMPTPVQHRCLASIDSYVLYMDDDF